MLYFVSMAKRPSVYDFESPIDFLQSHFAFLTQRNPQLSLPSIFLKRPEINVDLVRRILRETRRLSVPMASKLASALRLNEQETIYFETMALAELAPPESSLKFRNQLKLLKKEIELKNFHEVETYYSFNLTRTLTEGSSSVQIYAELRAFEQQSDSNISEHIMHFAYDHSRRVKNEILKDNCNFTIHDPKRFVSPGRCLPASAELPWTGYSFSVTYKDAFGAPTMDLSGHDFFGDREFKSVSFFRGINIPSMQEVVEGVRVSKSQFEDLNAKLSAEMRTEGFCPRLFFQAHSSK
jgi:hypothetical protein